MKTINPLCDTHEWFVRAVPKPTEKNLCVQVGVHLEEVNEFMYEMQTNDMQLLARIARAKESMQELSDYLKTQAANLAFTNREATLDSICDQLVTATGVAWMLGMDPVGGLAEVNRSNWSKFDNGLPIFSEHGKIVKGPSYTKPDLNPFV